MIKAIETTYKGYRFRSRLEARWAVFFDALSLKWEYEPEGFDLGSVGAYLPDFYLPDLGGGTWVEVKPSGADHTHVDEPKWRALALGTGKTFLLLAGAPGEELEHPCFVVDEPRWWISATWDSKYLPPRCHDGAPRLFYCPGGPEDFNAGHAVDAARSARFEHLGHG